MSTVWLVCFALLTRFIEGTVFITVVVCPV